MTSRRAEPSRFGIRARLLALLLPCVLGLLALDSWNDYRELQDLVQASYDRALLDSAEARRLGTTLAPDGKVQFEGATVEARRLLEAGGFQILDSRRPFAEPYGVAHPASRARRRGLRDLTFRALCRTTLGQVGVPHAALLAEPRR